MRREYFIFFFYMNARVHLNSKKKNKSFYFSLWDTHINGVVEIMNKSTWKYKLSILLLPILHCILSTGTGVQHINIESLTLALGSDS